MRDVWIGAVTETPESVATALSTGMGAAGHDPRHGDRWAVKLNLTYPTYLPGAVSSPVFIEGLCRWASDAGIRVALLEGDGGNGAYSAEDTFAGNGVTEVAARYGMECVSLSEQPWEWRDTEVLGTSVQLPYSPYFRRREYDVFATAPLFKNHIFTTVSLGMKNLWGAIPDAYRMYYHHMLDHGIVALAKELRPDCSIFDGLVAMRGNGPIDGTPVPMNVIMTASSVGAGERAALEVMGVGIEQVRHLAIAEREGLLPTQVNWLAPTAGFFRKDFVVRRTLLNKLSIRVAASPICQRLVYHSPLSPLIYHIVNRARPASAQAALHDARRAGTYRSIEISKRRVA